MGSPIQVPRGSFCKQLFCDEHGARFHPLQPDVMLVGDKDGRVKIVNTGPSASTVSICFAFSHSCLWWLPSVSQRQVPMSDAFGLRRRCFCRDIACCLSCSPSSGWVVRGALTARQVDNCALLGLSWLRHAPNVAASCSDLRGTA